METLVEAFDAAQDDVPTLFIAWTIKGYGLPFAGHKDNHAGLMNPTQMAALREAMGVARRRGMGAARGRRRQCPRRRRGADRAQPHRARKTQPRRSARSRSPQSPRRPARSNRPRRRSAGSCSICRKAGGALADRIVTTSPDVTVSTNLGAWVNQRGLFRRREMADVFAEAKIASAQKWSATTTASISNLGIAENNLFLMLAAAGLAGDLFGDAAVPDRHALRPVHRPRPRCAQLRLLPGRALHAGRDPERDHARARGRRAPVDQPAADRARPAGPAPLRAGLRRRARGDDGGSLPADRRSRRRKHLFAPLDPLDRAGRADRRRWRRARSQGGYWLRAPAPGAEAAIVAMGAVMPEALAAWEELTADIPGLGLLAITSPDLLHRGWTAAQAARWDGARASRAMSRQLLSASGARRRARHHRRRRSSLAVVARRRARPARRPAWESSGSARPAACPTSTPPIGSTARDHRRRRRAAAAARSDSRWMAEDAISTSGRSATASPTRSPAPSPRPTMC